jgi:hypothetical protein
MLRAMLGGSPRYLGLASSFSISSCNRTKGLGASDGGDRGNLFAVGLGEPEEE